MDTVNSKLKRLKEILKGMKSVVVAYSGGVDSTFLLKVARDILSRKNVLAVIARSPTYTKSEYKEAVQTAKKFGIKFLTIQTNEVEQKEFKNNPPNRCYYCKKELFSRLKKIAKAKSFNYVIDGTNLDDQKDYRPGQVAKEQLKVRSPLKEAKLTKKDIRAISKKMGLPTWDKPALACLASRFPYGQKIKKNKLQMVEEAEEYLRKLGAKQIRVRCYNTTARIEVLPEEINKLTREPIRKNIIKKLKTIGFNYVSVDLEGYRTGSMNEVIGKTNPKKRADKKIKQNDLSK